jgi:hypothetical protein
MTLEKFIKDSGLADLDEWEKALYFAFYHLKKSAIEEFSPGEAANWIRERNMGNPNSSRLGTRLRYSRSTVKGGKNGSLRLHHKFVTEMEEKFPQLAEKSQEVMDDGAILPPVLYENTRGYIASLAKQINRSYEENIFDGCAVLMRRLEEVLLILSYQHLKIDDQIKDPQGNYVLLEGIVTNAQSNKTLNLSRNGKKTIEKIREMGNYSAHQITYQCRREWIQEKIEEYRALVTELLSKAGIK